MVPVGCVIVVLVGYGRDNTPQWSVARVYPAGLSVRRRCACCCVVVVVGGEAGGGTGGAGAG